MLLYIIEVGSSASTLLLILLSIVVLVCGSDFSSRAINNVLISGTKRSKYYLGKFMTILLLTSLLFFIYYFISFILGVVFSKGSLASGELLMLLQIIGTQLFIAFAFATVTMSLAFITRSSSKTISWFFVFYIVPSILFSTLPSMNSDLIFLVKFDLVNGMNYVLQAPLLKQGVSEVPFKELLGISAFYIATSYIGGLYIFQKSEIK